MENYGPQSFQLFSRSSRGGQMLKPLALTGSATKLTTALSVVC